MKNGFNHADTFKSSFENKCIRLIVDAYQTSLIEKRYSIDWIENDFTSLLNHLIAKSSYRIHNKISNKREEHLFDDKKAEQKGFADSENRIDLVFSTFKSNKEFHLFFEAKRLKEADSNLHKRYIDTGIDNFLSGKYPRGHMIAYLVEGNTNNTINNGINEMLIRSNRENEILFQKEIQTHNLYFESTHPEFGVLKHFIFDFTIK